MSERSFTGNVRSVRSVAWAGGKARVRHRWTAYAEGRPVAFRRLTRAELERRAARVRAAEAGEDSCRGK